MSLVNLFPSRKSQKNKKDKKSAKASNNAAEISSADPDIIAVVNELINAVSKEKTANVPPQIDEVNESLVSSTEISEFVEMTERALGCESLKGKICKPFSEEQDGVKKKVNRSVSVNASEIESQTKSVRRKFGSEGEILSVCENVFSPEKQKELNEAMEKYIEKLIKDSINKTLQSVNVDTIRDDLMKKISNGNLKDHESEEVIEKKSLISDSISELVESGNTEDDGINKNLCHKDSLHSDSDGKLSETENTDNEIDELDQSLGGYLADLDDTTSIDDLKSIEGDSLNNSSRKGLRKANDSEVNLDDVSRRLSQNIEENKSPQNVIDTEVDVNNEEIENVINVTENSTLNQESITSENGKEEYLNSEEYNTERKEDHQAPGKSNEKASPDRCVSEEEEQQIKPSENRCQELEKLSAQENKAPISECPTPVESTNGLRQELHSVENSNEGEDLILMSTVETSSVPNKDQNVEDIKVNPLDVDEGIPEQKTSNDDDRLKVNWKVGNLHVKLPHKTRGKAHLKAWKKRRVVIQPDEFVNDPKNPGLVISVYGSDSKKHETTFWYSLSSQKAVIFRSSSRSHRYAFTISEGSQAIIHLSAENETVAQEWMAAIRSVLWPPSPFMELEKMMSGREFDVSIIDNEFSYRAGLLGMYGFLTITPKKLILLHPQEGYVIQEWYLNTVDKFQFMPQSKAVDMHKVLCMTTCSDSSTGQGEILFFCSQAVTLLQSLASNIHEVLSYHSKQEGGRYKKELEEIAEWLVVPPQDCLNVENDEHYKVPPRQVKSLLDIPNFIFNKSLSPVTSAIYPAPNSEIMEPLDAKKNNQTRTSHDSGISSCASADDFLNCSVASFIIGGGPMTGKSSDSELSDAYTPPRTPEVKRKAQYEVVKEEIAATEE